LAFAGSAGSIDAALLGLPGWDRRADGRARLPLAQGAMPARPAILRRARRGLPGEACNEIETAGR
jgi:hypothetical protein